MDLNEKQVIDEYRGADLTRRLHIYLQFPQLRSDFLAIDCGDQTVKRFRNKPHRDFSPIILVGGLLRLSKGFLKGLVCFIDGHAPRIT